MLIDVELYEKGVGGGDSGLMQWRVEGTTIELPPLLPVGIRLPLSLLTASALADYADPCSH